MIKYRQAAASDRQKLYDWFHAPHAQAYWDTSDEMWQNVENYLNGAKEIFDYWIGELDSHPFCLVITSDAHDGEGEGFPFNQPKGTMTLDFMIGDPQFLGKGLASQALVDFTQIERSNVTGYVIDPDISHEKATHVYQKAGFKTIGEHTPKEGPFKGIKHCIMFKRASGASS